LKGFQRVNVIAGETTHAVIKLPFNSFEFFDRTSGKMDVAAGEYDVLYGNSSDTKDLKIIKMVVQR